MISGLEPWFQLPGQPRQTAPRRYKQALVVWVGVAGLSLLVGPLVATLLADWPGFLRILINTGITVALLIYWVMPFLTQHLKGWLFKA